MAGGGSPALNPKGSGARRPGPLSRVRRIMILGLSLGALIVLPTQAAFTFADPGTDQRASRGTPAAARHDHLPCESCHGGTVPLGGESQIRVGSDTGRCISCHERAVRASHPVGFAPQRPLPHGFPLDGQNRMTCSTCHDLHGERSGLRNASTDHAAFCISCHEPAFFEAMADRGLSLFRSGHLDAAQAHPRDMDAFSIRCMTCHSENATPRGPLGSWTSSFESGFGAINHPVGSRYAEAVRYGGYRSQRDVSGQILLPDGRVSCVSCHEPYSREHGRVPRDRDGLCAKCHAL